MNNSPPSLQDQLLARVAQFQKQFPNITQAEIARQCGIGEANFSAAIAGRRGLSANSCLKLHKLLNLSRNEVIKKFIRPARSSKILNLQESVQGQPARMRLDNSGWYPGTGGSGAGQDPADGRTIDDAPDAVTAGPGLWNQDLIDTLREARGYHRLIVRAINNFIQNAKANRDGSTAATAQRFSTRNIIKTMCFATDDAPTATKDLLAVLSTLDPQTRTRVISSILAAFPQFSRT
jgi:hypothetical protein